MAELGLWVLILLYWPGDNKTSSAMLSQEFSSRETCMAALAATRKEFDAAAAKAVGLRNVYGVCAKK